MTKRSVPLYDFAAFRQAIKAARTARKESHKDVSDAMHRSSVCRLWEAEKTSQGI